MPTSSGQIDFESLQNVNNQKQALWNNETISEYYLKLPVVNDSILDAAVYTSFKFNGYKNVLFNSEGNYYMAKRGIRMNEWGTVTNVYLRSKDEYLELYIRSEISQDNTGGWRENRAKKVALKIQETLEQRVRGQNNVGDQ